MAVTAPSQERSLDPFSESRYSDRVNRMTRMVTEGRDVVLFPEQSFSFSKKDDNTLTIGQGVAIKDDVLIDIPEDYDLDLTETYYYNDSASALVDGIYLVVLEYIYDRSFPAPTAYFKVYTDRTNYDADSDDCIFLGTITITGGVLTTTFSECHSTPTEICRPVNQESGLAYLDGGVVT